MNSYTRVTEQTCEDDMNRSSTFSKSYSGKQAWTQSKLAVKKATTRQDAQLLNNWSSFIANQSSLEQECDRNMR